MYKKLDKAPFDIAYMPGIKAGAYKVETREGYPVDILKTDARGAFPLLSLIHYERFDSPYLSYLNGTLSSFGKPSNQDLFVSSIQ